MSHSDEYTDKPTHSDDKDTPTPDDLDEDTIHFLLSSERRRESIRAILEARELDRSELIEAVAAAEFGDDVTADERQRIRVSLLQAHLPKLEESGIIVEVGEHRYRAGPNIEAVRGYFDDGLHSKITRFLRGGG